MPMKPKDMLRLFKKNGWQVLRQKGSHVTMGKGSRRAVIPMHGADLKKGLEHALLKLLAEAGETQ
jgi:mRNA interferase HicA